MAEKNHRNELKGKDKFLAGLSTFLVKNKALLWILLAVAAAVIIAVAVFDSIAEKKANIASESVELIQEKYNKWLSDAEDVDKEALEAEIIEEADRIAVDYSSTFAAQRAVYIKGNISFINEDWAAASTFFIDAAALNSDSYLAPITLMLAASSLENDGKYSEALNVYSDIYARYDKIFPDIPRVMLSMARLNEQIGDFSSATDSYNLLLDNYPGSGWASFARTRLIQMDK